MSKVIGFYSPAGGVGKSTLASVMALKLSEMQKKVILVDLSLFSSLDVMFRISAVNKGLNRITSLFDNKGSSEEFKTEIREKGIVRIEKFNNLEVIPAASPIKMDKLSGESVEQLITELKEQHYDYIIIDTSSDLSERNIKVFEMVDQLNLVINQDISTIWRVNQLKDIFNSLYIENHKLNIVLNRFRKDVRYNAYEVEETVGIPVYCQIPDYKGVIVDLFNVEAVDGIEKNRITLSKFHKAMSKLIEGEIDEDRGDNKIEKKRKKFGFNRA